MCVWGGQTLPLACSTHHTAICSACDWNGYRMWFYVALIFTEQFSDHYWCLEDLKKKSLQKRPLPSRWTWSLIMVFSGICFIPWRFDRHKIPPPAFKDCQRMGCVPCKGIYDFFLKQISGKKSNGNVKRSWGRLNPWYWRCKLCALL